MIIDGIINGASLTVETAVPGFLPFLTSERLKPESINLL